MTKLLIIEDDPMVRFIHKNYLAKIDDTLDVYMASSYTEGLELIDTLAPNLILLDLTLTDGYGLDLLTAIRQKELDTEIILITAEKSAATVKKSRHLGVLDYLVKPFSFERFNESIQLYLNRLSNDQLVPTELTQDHIDHLVRDKQEINQQIEVVDWVQTIPLDKGMSRQTLISIVELLAKQVDWVTIQQLSEASQLSHVSVRKYIQFLETNNHLEREIVYLKVGRPYYLYRLI